MASYRIKRFSDKKMSYADEDYINDRENERMTTGDLVGLTVLGGGLGASIGRGFDKSSNLGAGTAIGGALGAGGGYLLGKSLKNSKDKEVDHKIARYKAGTKEDRKHLRDREEEVVRRREHRETIDAMKAPKDVRVTIDERRR